MDFEASFSRLDAQLSALRQKFVAQHLASSGATSAVAPPAVYEADVKAYCVLCHAAFEEYVEDIAGQVVCEAVNGWTNGKHISLALLSLFVFCGKGIEIPGADGAPEPRIFDEVRCAAEELKAKHTKLLHVDNHGFSPRYLRAMLLPVGIELPSDVKLIGAVQQLAKERGAHAHRASAKKVASPEDAIKFVDDCLQLCTLLKADAQEALGVLFVKTPPNDNYSI